MKLEKKFLLFRLNNYIETINTNIKYLWANIKIKNNIQLNYLSKSNEMINYDNCIKSKTSIINYTEIILYFGSRNTKLQDLFFRGLYF